MGFSLASWHCKWLVQRFPRAKLMATILGLGDEVVLYRQR